MADNRPKPTLWPIGSGRSDKYWGATDAGSGRLIILSGCWGKTARARLYVQLAVGEIKAARWKSLNQESGSETVARRTRDRPGRFSRLEGTRLWEIRRVNVDRREIP